ncbi:MAG: hypothetical protein ACP5DY_03290 [Thermovirgaceae bacterium]
MKDPAGTFTKCSLFLALAAVLFLSPLSPSWGYEGGILLEEHPKGFRVVAVEEGSLADASGLMTDDIIREADFRPVAGTSPEVLQQRLAGLQGTGGSILLKVERSSNVRLIRAKQALEFRDRTAFDQTRTTLLEAWETCENAWKRANGIVRISYLEGINDEREAIFDDAFETFQSAKNRMIATNIPPFLPEKAGAKLREAKSHFVSAAGSSLFAVRALEDDLSKGHVPDGPKRASFNESQIPANFDWEENWILQFDTLPGGYKSFYRSMLTSRGKAFSALLKAETLMQHYQ